MGVELGGREGNRIREREIREWFGSVDDGAQGSRIGKVRRDWTLVW